MSISIRDATESDADKVADLTVQLGYDVETFVVNRRLSTILQRPDQRFVVAEDNGHVVGWLHVMVFEYIEADPFVAIGGLVVDRSRRRQGIGRALVEYAEAWAKEQRCSIVRLSSSAGRAEAHEFYERLGYRNIKTQYAFAKPVDSAGLERLKRLVPRIEADAGRPNGGT